MKVHELAVRLMRRAEEAVDAGLKLRAEVFEDPKTGQQPWLVMMGGPEDNYVVARFSDPENANRFAEEVNVALGPIARRRAIAIISESLEGMADDLASIEMEPRP